MFELSLDPWFNMAIYVSLLTVFLYILGFFTELPPSSSDDK